jgi:tetratricopeptide (TPR) repeat protein
MLLAFPVAVQTIDTKKLRELISWPRVHVDASWRMGAREGFLFGKPDWTARIAETRKRVRGDASDAERYHEIANSYSHLDDDKNAHAAFEHAAVIYRQQLREQPNNPALLSALGDLLVDFDQDEEGEQLLRRAVKLAPGDWHCWVNLGCYLKDAASRLSDRPATKPGTTAGAVQTVAASSVKSIDGPKIQRLLGEATECFDKAIATGPQQAEPYRERLWFRIAEAQLADRVDIGHDRRLALEKLIVSGAHLADARRAAELDPTSIRDLMTAAYLQITFGTERTEVASEGLWRSLPKDIQGEVQTDIDRLSSLAHSKDATTAIGANQSCALLQAMLFGDSSRACQYCRAALTLDRSDDFSWSLLLGMQKDEQKRLALALECLQIKESAERQYEVATCYANLGQWERAEDHVRAALRLEPKEPGVRVALNACLLRKASSAQALADADRKLKETAETLEGDALISQRAHCLTLRGVCLALENDLSGAIALLKEARETDPTCKDADKVLAALQK